MSAPGMAAKIELQLRQRQEAMADALQAHDPIGTFTQFEVVKTLYVLARSCMKSGLHTHPTPQRHDA